MVGSESPAATTSRDSGVLWKPSRADKVRDDRSAVRRVIDWLQAKPPPIPIVHSRPVLTPKAGRIGICCSGGGIRSAAYNLGALQTLQQHGVLQQAEYLSAVSGGSYIAGSLATVASHSDPGALATGPVYGPGSPEERHLRNHSSYLAPGWIIGKVRLLLRMLQGMAMNLLFLGAVLYIAGALYGAVVSSRGIYPQLRLPNHAGTINFGVWSWIAVGIPAATWIILAVPDLIARVRDSRSIWLETWSARMLGLALFALATVIGVPAALIALRGHSPDTTLQGAAHVIGVLKSGSPNTSECAHPSQVAMTSSCTASASGLLALISAAGLGTAALGAIRAFFARRRSWLALIAGAVAGPLLVLSAFMWAANEVSARA
jgi:hypothetical protein